MTMEINEPLKVLQEQIEFIKYSPRFITYVDGLPSYMVKAYDVIYIPRSASTSKEIKKLTLKCWAINEFEMKNFFKHYRNSILIKWLDQQGLVIDSLEFQSCELESVSFSNDWSDDINKPMEVTVCYRYDSIKDVYEPNGLD